MPSVTRRSVLGLAAAAVARPVLAQPVLTQPALAKGTTLTISTWGGVTSDGLRDYLAPEFEKLTGAKLAYDIGGMGARYNKLLAQKGNQSVDVFFGTDEAVVGGFRQGVLEPADLKALPNYADLHDWAKAVKAPSPDQALLVANTLISYCLAYNPQVVKTPPASWGDLWRPEFQGKLALASPSHSMMPALVIMAAELAGGGVDNVDPGFEKLAKLRPNKLTVFWTDWAPLAKTGDATAATEFDYYLESMKAQGYPIDYVFPKEGALGSVEGGAIVAGTKNKALAEAFLNLTIDPKIQEVIAEKLYEGPTNRKVQPSASVASKMSYGEEKMKKIRFFDPVVTYENRPAWTERLTTEVVPEWKVR